MFGIRTFITGTIVGGAAALFATNYHVVNTSEGVTVLPRSNSPALRSTYVDVRRWNLAMWKQYPDVAAAMVDSGRTDLMLEGVVENLTSDEDAPTIFETLGTALREQQQLATGQKTEVPIKFSNDDSTPAGDEHNVARTPIDFSAFVNQHFPSTIPEVRDPFHIPIELGEESRMVPVPMEFQPVSTTTPSNDMILPESFTSAQQELSREIFQSLQSQAESVVGEVLPSQESILKGLPNVDIPQPLNEQQLSDLFKATPQKPQTLTESGTNAGEPDWVRGLLRSMIPQTNSSPTDAADVTLPRPPFKIDAPNPTGVSDDLTQQWIPSDGGAKPPIQAVRPF